MPVTTYERAFSQFTSLLFAHPDTARLISEIQASPIVPGIDYASGGVTVSEGAQKAYFTFKDAIVESNLDDIVATHTGEPYVTATQVTLAEEHDPKGVLRVADAHKIVEETYQNRGFRWTVTAGQTNFFDVQANAALIYLSGGSFSVRAALDADIHDDDYAEFSIVDKDDVLGLFSSYGLTVGVDVLELQKYVVTHYFTDTDNGVRHHIEPGTLAEIVAGLYMRAAYISNGATDLTFTVWYNWFET